MLSFTRREFTKLALAAMPATALTGSLTSALAAEKSKAGATQKRKAAGVVVGLNVPYSFGNPAMSGDEILKNCVELGLTAVELRTQPVEAFLGAPAALVSAKGDLTKGAAAKAQADELRAWRLAAPLARVREFRQKYETAGVKIDIVKVDRIFQMQDDVLDYAFALAKALGARAISTEISKNDADHQRLGQFADKHQFWVGYHGHASTGPADWEKAFSFARYNGANVDLGHFVAGNHGSPVPFLEKHHARITHVHVKDRKKNNGANTPFGEGETPIVEVLRLIRDRGWPIQATIEFEYKVPAGSTRMAEIAKAIKFCRDAVA